MTEQTKLALELAIQKGILVVPVTGRCLEGLPAKIRRMDGVEYFITSNGQKHMILRSRGSFTAG